MKKKKKKKLNFFFSEQIERFLFRAFWSTAIICNLSSSDKKKKKKDGCRLSQHIHRHNTRICLCEKKKKKYW